MDRGAEKVECDIAIIGAGVLGVSIYHWLTSLTDKRVILIDKENKEAFHTSSRNTGVIHRPFYLDPSRKGIQARSAGSSYFMWKDLAKLENSPWKQCGTVEVITDESGHATLEKYSKWSAANGLEESDYEILTGEEVSGLEKEVHCLGAIHSKTDVSTDFGILTGLLLKHSGGNGTVMFNSKVTALREDKSGCSLSIISDGSVREVKSRLVLNASGGGSLNLAHRMGYAKQYTVLYFRGEYWKVSENYRGNISRNIYSVPRHPGYPFLDPHFIIRADGGREIGPNAVLVGGPEVYSGMSGPDQGIVKALLDSPLKPKLRLLFNTEFMKLVSTEWKSSLYKSEMASRIRKFIPSLETDYLTTPGVSGVRASLIDRKGFVPEAITIFGESSVHILNYNSPGATGAPTFAAYLISEMIRRGYIEELSGKPTISGNWDFQKVSSYVAGA